MRVTVAISVLSAIFVGALLTVASPIAPQASAAPEAFAVDPIHSFVGFRIKHLNVGFLYGRFNEFSGKVTMDTASPEASSVQFEIKVASVDTANAQRDDHLRSPDFFGVQQFPTMSFQSTSVKKAEANNYDVSGNLTIHGVTKAVTVRMQHTGSGNHPQTKAPIVGFEGTLDIRRSDFGMTSMIPAAADEVRLIIAIEAKK